MTLDVAWAAVAVCGVSGSGAALLNGRQTPACVEVRIILLSSWPSHRSAISTRACSACIMAACSFPSAVARGALACAHSGCGVDHDGKPPQRIVLGASKVEQGPSRRRRRIRGQRHGWSPNRSRHFSTV